MKQKVISLTLCLSILLGSMGQMFAVQTERSDTQTSGHTAEVLSELQQAKEEAEDAESGYDPIEVDGINYVCVDENCEPIEKGDSTEPAGVAVYSVDSDSETITIPSAVTIPDTEQELPVIAIHDFAFCVKDSESYINETTTNIELPETIQVIGKSAFGENNSSACIALKSITIPNGVKQIKDCAFAFCEALERVSISSSVEIMGVENPEADIFMGCASLTAITVDESNTNYSSLDGTLYNKDKTVLLCCPMGKSGELKMAPGVTKIGDDALVECDQLTSVIFSDTVKIIGVCAFSKCSGLTTLNIPVSVEEIGDFAFEWCDGLSTIRFLGDYPFFGEYVFDEVTATAYYPISWTEVPSADEVGGDITWIPDIPTVGSLKAASASYNSAKISWGKVSGADGYVVYRKKGSSWKRLGTTTSTSYTDKNLTCGTTYTYTVRAYKTVDGSEVKGGYDAKGVSVKVVPATVKLGTATASGSSIKVTWNTVSGANGYTVYRKTPSASKWKNLKSVGSSTTSYTDKNLNAGKYIYTVRAYRTVSDSKVLGGYDANGVSASITPAAPKLSGLSGSANSITVKWGEIAGADGYRVYRKTGSGKWKKLKEITDGSTVAYKDTAAEGGATYTYTVRAFIKDGDEIILSSYDEKGLSVTIAEQPVLVGAAAKVSSNQMSVTVTWEQAKNAEGYVVYRLGDNDTKWRKLAAISGGSTTSYRDSKPEGGVNYAYTVRAYTTAGKARILSTYDTVGVSAFIPA